MDPCASFGFIIVGASSWITINGLYSELGLMVDSIPESWAIGTYLTFIIQLANIAVICYSFIPNHYKTHKFIAVTTYIILFVSFISMISMAFTWKHTISIFNAQHSIPLLLTSFGTSLSDCMTSMVFWVFVSWYPSKFISILSAGESSSGIIVSILIWIQQLGTDTPRYSVETFLILLALILPSSAVAFTLLLKYKAQINAAGVESINPNNNMRENLILNAVEQPVEKRVCYYKHLLILGALSGIQNGMIPSIGTYALLPYGKKTYMFASTISSCVAPLSASLPSFAPKVFVNDSVINILTFVWVSMSFYVLFIALCSPNPWGLESGIGAFVIALCYILYSAALSCCKSCCITFIQNGLLEEQKVNKSEEGDESNRMMENIGKVIQFGSFVVSILFFVLVQYAGIFHQ